jgi:hypothetical protein
MTEQAVKEATKYVEQSIESQMALGYKRPKRAIVKEAIDETAAALRALQGLKARNGRR